MSATFALTDLLRTEGLASSRVWRPRLPRDQNEHMPRQAIVVRGAGGGALTAGYMPTTDARVDVRCYGADDREAGELHAAVASFLHHLRATTTTHGRILWCRIAGDASDTTEPDTDWPVTLSSWQVYGTWLKAS